MNRSLLSLALGGVVLWGSYSYEGITPQDEAIPVSVDVASAASLSLSSTSPPYALQTVEGISLYDDQQAVVEHLGAPENIESDPYTEQLEIYQYEGIQVGFSAGYVDFVRVLPEAGAIHIDGNPIPMTLEAMTGQLGQPDFVAEDGLVFKRREAAIKLFLDETKQHITSIDYFHRTHS